MAGQIYLRVACELPWHFISDRVPLLICLFIQAFDALIHFIFEGSFLWLSVFGRQVNTQSGPFAELCMLMNLHVWRFPYNYHCFRERILCCRLQMGCCWSCCRFSRNLDCSRCWTFVLLHFEAACKWWSCTSLLVGRALYGWTLWRVRVIECKWRHFIYHFIAGWPSARNGLLVARTWTHRMHCISGCILL